MRQAADQTFPLRRVATLWFALTVLAAAHVHADQNEIGGNLIRNGDFETATFSDWAILGAVNVVSDRQLASAGATGEFRTGHVIAVMGGGNQVTSGLLQQEFRTSPGKTYLLEFDYGKYGFGTGPQSMEIEAV